MNKTYVTIVSFLIIIMLAVCVQSCNITRALSPGPGFDDIPSIPSIPGDVADNGETPKKKLSVSNSTHFLFYVLGALCLVGAGGIMVVVKHLQSALIFVGLGFLFFTVPMYLETLVIMLGAFKILIYVVVFALLAAGLFVLFLKLRNVYHDMTHPDEDDLHPETAKIREAAKQKVAIKKIKSKGV